MVLKYHSPKAYRYLSSVFSLSKKFQCSPLASKISIQVGWSKQSLTVLKKRAETMSKEGILYDNVFDAMTIKESLHFDQASDSIIGREDLGDHGKSLKQTNHALVFVVKGLFRKWKRVLGQFFVLGGIDTGKLKNLYETAITKVQESGFKVVFTVCDEDGVHHSLFQALGMLVDNCTFVRNGERVYFFFDPPHLLKTLTNTLLKYSVKIGTIFRTFSRLIIMEELD